MNDAVALAHARWHSALANPANEPSGPIRDHIEIHDAAVRAAVEGALPQPSERPWCRDCGPGYRLGDEGCRHDDHQPTEGDTGICRTCAQPIWYELGTIGHRERLDWSDRITRGGDSIVCFKAIGYRHVPMGAREEAIYHAGSKATARAVLELCDEWDRLSKGETPTTRRIREALR